MCGKKTGSDNAEKPPDKHCMCQTRTLNIITHKDSPVSKTDFKLHKVDNVYIFLDSKHYTLNCII